MLVLLQIATAIVGITVGIVSNSIGHTGATVRITVACKLEWVAATVVRTRVNSASAAVLLVPSGDRFTVKRCSLAYSIMQY